MSRKKALKVVREPTDTERLDLLSKMTGFVCGTFEGEPSYRIMSRSAWHPTLRGAIDELFSTITPKGTK